ncbi:MAG: hypothetical protein ACREDR_34665, partial [Blastocatellia bacterium]
MASVVMTLPQTIPDTGIRHTLLEDLALKILFTNGELSLADLADRICLGLGAVEEIFQALRKQQLCEVKGMDGVSHRITTSAAGRMRASELFALNQYAGPAPVSLLDYTLRVQASTIERTSIRPELLARAFHPLLIDTDLFSRLGTAVVSGTSMFLYGPPGTGKTSIGSRIAAIYDDQVWIPYAVEVDNQILTVYDPGVHRKKEVPAHDVDDLDKRWVYCRRPCIIAGGELCAEMLDLQFNPLTRFCTAPLQMKANNGVLLLDDFGRQRMRPKELLNR